MRKLMWFSLGFAAACAVGVWLLPDARILIFGGCCLIPGLGACFFPPARRAAVAAVGIAAGSLWVFGYSQLYLRPLQTVDEQTVPLEVEITEYSSGNLSTGRAELCGKPYRFRLYLPEPAELCPGDRLTGDFTLRVRTQPSQHADPGDGIFLTGYAGQMPRLTAEQYIPYRYVHKVLGHKTALLLSRLCPADTGGFLQALLLGKTDALSYGQDLALRRSGLRHVAAVSGLHICVLFGLVMVLVMHRRSLAALLGIPVLLLFAGMTGFSPSVVRACLMELLVLLSMLTSREYDQPTALSFAALGMLMWNPWTVSSVSFQLSVGSIAGILLFSRRIHGYFIKKTDKKEIDRNSLKIRLYRAVADSLAVTAGAMAFTVPLCAHYFGTVSMIGFVSNLLLLGVITLCFCGALCTVVLGAIWVPLGRMMAWLVAWPVRLVLWLAGLLGKIPFACVGVDNVYVMAWLVFAYVLVLLFALSRKKHPLMLGTCLLAGLILTGVFNFLESRTCRFQLTVLDVGQGQCVLFRDGDRCYAVDCGGDFPENTAEQAVQQLHRQGIFRLDGLILTHYDRDHIGGALPLLMQMPTDMLYVPDAADADPDLLSRAGCPVTRVCSRTSLVCGATGVTLYPGESGTSGNETSLCALFRTGKYDILVTGDRSMAGEHALLEQANLPDLEILVVGHHGSDSSTGLELLRRTTPEVAVISAGRDNPFGHPGAQTLKRLELFGCRILRTDRLGTIVIRG